MVDSWMACIEDSHAVGASEFRAPRDNRKPKQALLTIHCSNLLWAIRKVRVLARAGHTDFVFLQF